MSNSIHQFKVQKSNGETVSLDEFKGKVCLIVNTASKCGFTPQYGELQKLYEEYKERDFVVLGFPSNDFQDQEPLEGEAINEFCQVNYGVSFPIFNKVNVKGSEAIDLFKFLSNKKENGAINSKPKWNFHKYLVDKDGQVIDYYYSITKPTSGKVKRAIEKLL